MILIFWMLFLSMKSQADHSGDCAENEHFSFESDTFCCDIAKDNGTMVLEFPGTVFERHQIYRAPNVCFYAGQRTIIYSHCVCNEGFDFKSKIKIPSETNEQKLRKSENYRNLKKRLP